MSPVVAPSLLTAAPAACSSNPFSLGMEDWDDSPESMPLKRTRHVQQPTDSEGAGPSSLLPSKKKRLSLSKPKQRWEFLECSRLFILHHKLSNTIATGNNDTHKAVAIHMPISYVPPKLYARICSYTISCHLLHLLLLFLLYGYPPRCCWDIRRLGYKG